MVKSRVNHQMYLSLVRRQKQPAIKTYCLR
jgi:hypothetical protein